MILKEKVVGTFQIERKSVFKIVRSVSIDKNIFSKDFFFNQNMIIRYREIEQTSH